MKSVAALDSEGIAKRGLMTGIAMDICGSVFNNKLEKTVF
jgi:hypothetical protein